VAENPPASGIRHRHAAAATIEKRMVISLMAQNSVAAQSYR
jgi:hypothetical protein